MTATETVAAEKLSGGMPLFAYEAQTADGKVFRGTLEGETAEAVRAKLAGLQLRVLAVEVAPEKGGRKGRMLGADDFLIFNQQLAHLTLAGLPVERGLRLIAADMEKGRLSRAAREVASELEGGVPLEEAFKRHAGQFPPLYGKLVEAGAKAGNLPGMLFNLGRHLELTARLRESLWRTLSYPVMVLVALMLVLLFLSQVVLPNFGDIYKDFNAELPLLTQMLISFGKIYPIVLVVMVLIVLVILGINVFLKVTGKGAVVRDRVMLNVPFVGKVLRAGLLARWLDALRMGVESGLDLPRAVMLAADATGTGGRLAMESAQLAEVVGRGQSPTMFHGRLIPAVVPAAMELGGRSTDLPNALLMLTGMYEQQAEHRLRLLPTILTPLLMLLVGSGVAFCIMAMFMPLVKLIQSVSGGEM